MVTKAMLIISMKQHSNCVWVSWNINKITFNICNKKSLMVTPISRYTRAKGDH